MIESLPKLNKKISLFSFSVFLFFCFFVFLFFSSPPPQDIKLSNLTDSQATISWRTKKPATGCLLFGEKQTCDQGYLHFFTAKNLSPNTTYTFEIKNNFRIFLTGEFTTNQTPSSPPSVFPAYGKVLGEGKPAIGALVFLSIGKKTVSTKTNDQGNWSADLSLLFPEGSKQKSPILLEAFSQDKGGSRIIFSDQVQPSQALYLR